MCVKCFTHNSITSREQNIAVGALLSFNDHLKYDPVSLLPTQMHFPYIKSSYRIFFGLLQALISHCIKINANIGHMCLYMLCGCVLELFSTAASRIRIKIIFCAECVVCLFSRAY